MLQVRGLLALRREKLYDVVLLQIANAATGDLVRFGATSASTGSTAQLLKVLLTEMPRCDVESMFCVVLQQCRDI